MTNFFQEYPVFPSKIGNNGIIGIPFDNFSAGGYILEAAACNVSMRSHGRFMQKMTLLITIGFF
jgi:hypothetical protein